MNKQTLITTGLVVGIIFLLNNWAPTKRLFNGEVDPSAAFWNR